MSQFQANFGFPTPGGDPLNTFAQFGGPFSQMGGFGQPARRAGTQTPEPSGGGYTPYRGGSPMWRETGLGFNRTGSQWGTRVPEQALRWDQALAGAMGADMANQQSGMNQLYGNLAGQIGQYEQDMLGGLQAFQQQTGQQVDVMREQAGLMQEQGQEMLARFQEQSGQLMGDITGRVDRADQEAASAIATMQQARDQYKDASAQNAANMAFGMRRNVESTLKSIETNPDMTPAEKQAARFQLYQESEGQITQGVSQIFEQQNQVMANFGSQISQLQLAKAQTTQAGAQLLGGLGQGLAAQSLQAEQMNLQMQELGANLNVAAEQAAASAQMQATMALLQGRKDLYEMIQGNPRQFVSQFAGLTGYLAGASTPGLQYISIPNFGNFA
jgi:hypothetical protein